MASTTGSGTSVSQRLRALRTTGRLYRGDAGMWSWVAHRITGLLTFFFLFVHVLDTALVRVSPNAYDEVIATYKLPVFALFEIGLVGAVLFHALNGIRVMLVDFWAKGPRYQKQMLWLILAIWVPVMAIGSFYLLSKAIKQLFGVV